MDANLATERDRTLMTTTRHCERSDAIQSMRHARRRNWIAAKKPSLHWVEMAEKVANACEPGEVVRAEPHPRASHLTPALSSQGGEGVNARAPQP